MKAKDFLKKGFLVIILAASVVVSVEEADSVITAKAAESSGNHRQDALITNEHDEYYNLTADYVESTMDAQMKALIYDLPGKRAEIYSDLEGRSRMESMRAEQIRLDFDYESWVVFTLDASKLDINLSDLAYYCWDAIANKETLCTLSIYGSGFVKQNGKIIVFIPSTIRVDEHAAYIKMYKSYMNYLEKKVDRTIMSDFEILTYYYDMLGQSIRYCEDVKNKKPDYDMTVHMPVSVVKRGDAVCQGYAVVLNQLIRHSGIASYILFGKVTSGGAHAWNAVKMGGKWYYSDLTWDDNDCNDTEGADRSLINHNLILFDVKTSGRELEPFYRKKFSEIFEKSGNEYEYNMLQNTGAKSGFHYAGGNWYFTVDGYVYLFDMRLGNKELLKDIPYDPQRFIGALGDELYIGGSDGLFILDPSSDTMVKKDSGSFRYGYVNKNDLVVQDMDTNQWHRVSDTSGDDFSDEDGIGEIRSTDCSMNYDVDLSGEEESIRDIVIPKVKVKSAKCGKIQVRIEGTAGGAHFQISDSRGFVLSNTKNYYSSKVKSTWIVNSLHRGTTYCVRVRGYCEKDGRKLYSGWSNVKVVKVR